MCSICADDSVHFRSRLINGLYDIVQVSIDNRSVGMQILSCWSVILRYSTVKSDERYRLRHRVSWVPILVYVFSRARSVVEVSS